MRLLFAIAAASLVLLAAQPAAAHRDWNWHRGGQSYYFRDLQQACGWGDRWACKTPLKELTRSRKFQQPALANLWKSIGKSFLRKRMAGHMALMPRAVTR